MNIKRLESSFYAFKKSIDRFLNIHDSFKISLKIEAVFIQAKGTPIKFLIL